MVVEEPDTTEVIEEPIEIIITVAGKVLDEATQEPVAAEVIIERLPDGLRLGTIDSDNETGEYSFKLKPGATYGFLAQAEGYLSRNENIDLNDTEASETINQNLILTPIVQGAIVEVEQYFLRF